MICELAAFERAREEVTASPANIETLLFDGTATPSGAPAAYAYVIDDAVEHSPHQLAAFALWGVRASTWKGQYGIYLEDLYVREDRRHLGHGKALLERLALECEERGYPRFEWSVLDWNEPAAAFYRDFGASPLNEWVLWRRTFDQKTS